MQRAGLRQEQSRLNWLHLGQILIREGEEEEACRKTTNFLLGNKKLLASPAAYLAAVTCSFFPGLKSTTLTPTGASLLLILLIEFGSPVPLSTLTEGGE